MKDLIEQPRFLKTLELMSEDVQKEFISLLLTQSDNECFDFNPLFASTHFQKLDLKRQQLIKKDFQSYRFTLITNGNSIVLELSINNRSEEPCIIKLVPQHFISKINDRALAVFSLNKIEGVSLVTSYKIINFNGEDGHRLLLMPKVGNDVDQYLQNPTNTRPIEECFWIYSKMALALQSMCANGIFFPDLKNTNWQYVKSNTANFGKLMLADTKSLEEISSEEILTESLHTIPPEYIRGNRPSNPNEAEAYSVYGWAINLIEILSQNTIDQLIDKDLEDPEDLNVLYPKIFKSRNKLLECIYDIELKTLLKRCIDSDPNKRPRFSEILVKIIPYQTRAFPIIDELNQNLSIASIFDQKLSAYINDIEHRQGLKNYQSNAKKLQELKNCKHLQEFYTIIHELTAKEDFCFSTGYEKATKVMQAFVQIPVEDRLNPNAAGWTDVMNALQVKRGFFSSSSYHSFKNCLDRQKEALKNTHSNAEENQSRTPGRIS